jgi:Holliday junction DNA helicase RuvB
MALCPVHHTHVHDGIVVVRGTISKGVEFLRADLTPYVGEESDDSLESLLHEEIGEEVCEEICEESPPTESVESSTHVGEQMTAKVDEQPFAHTKGHAHAVASLTTLVAAARQSGRVPPAVLLTGPAGVGKTSLAGAFARELGVQPRIALGSFLDEPAKMVGLLMGLKPGDVLFIDEIHAVKKSALEVLYTAVEGGSIDLLSSGPKTRTTRLELKPFTLVAATTEEAKLPQPFLSRFGLKIELEPLAPEEATQLVCECAEQSGCSIEARATEMLVQASRGNPRKALSLVQHAVNAVLTRGGQAIEGDDARKALDTLDLDAQGLDRVQRRIVSVLLERGRPTGVLTLATLVGKTPEALQEIYEPELLRAGLILRTPLGRVAKVAS